MYAFSAEHLALDNHFVCSSLEKKISSTLSISCLPVTLFVGLKPCGLPHFHTVMSLGLVFFSVQNWAVIFFLYFIYQPLFSLPPYLPFSSPTSFLPHMCFFSDSIQKGQGFSISRA